MSDQRTHEHDDVVVERGPVSGTGEALPDSDALAILDERVGPTAPEHGVPDIGVVIDPGSEEKTAGSSQQPFVITGTWPTLAPSSLKPRTGHLEYGSKYFIDDSRQAFSECQKMFEPYAPKTIVSAPGIRTPLKSIIDCSYDYRLWREGRSSSWNLHSSLILLVIHGNSRIEVELSPVELEKSGATLFDLLRSTYELDR
jgi:hypothetical protein